MTIVDINLNNVQEKNDNFPYSQILLPFKRSPIIPIDPSQHIREMGNIIYSELLGKYVTSWSQGDAPYDHMGIYVYMAISDFPDKDWEVIGKIVTVPSEDPYLVEENGYLYVLFEKKKPTGLNQDDIGLWKLTDPLDLLNGWVDLGYALQKDGNKDWQIHDVSSPTYLREEGTSYLFFEGRGEINGEYQSGAIGLATSTGIEDVFTQTDLIVSGSSFPGRESDTAWGTAIVCDDIVKIRDTYYLITHTSRKVSGDWYTNIFQSKELTKGWTEHFGSEITYTNRPTNNNGSGAPIFGNITFIIEDGNIFLGRWGTGFIPPTPGLDKVAEENSTVEVKLSGSEVFPNKNPNDFAQIGDISSVTELSFAEYRTVWSGGSQVFQIGSPIKFLFGVYVNGVRIDSLRLYMNNNYGAFEILDPLEVDDIVTAVFYKDRNIMLLSYDPSSSLNLLIETASGDDWEIDWGDGVWERYVSSSTYRTKTFSSSTSGVARVRSATGRGLSDIRRFQSTGSTAWNFDLGVFIPLTGLTNFQLNNLPNANIDGSINSFISATGLTVFWLYDLPNANIDGSLNSFSGAIGLTDFRLNNLPNANIDGSLNSFSGAIGLTDFRLNNLPNSIITGGSSAFANKTNLGDFLIRVSPSSTITIEYDDILNIWQSSVYILYRDSGISASKATTDPFNFTEIRTALMYFQNIGLSTQSMDNMIIALDNSLITQTAPKTISLALNAPHSGSPAVMTSLSNLATKNVTVVL